MKKLPNWKAALEAEFTAARTRQFAWGSFDCAIFACDCVRAQTGADPGAGFRGTYSTQAGAEALGNLAQIAGQTAANCGLTLVPVNHARRGDLALVDNGTAQGALAVIDFSAMYAVCPAAATGLIRVRRYRWQRCWRVG